MYVNIYIYMIICISIYVIICIYTASLYLLYLGYISVQYHCVSLQHNIIQLYHFRIWDITSHRYKSMDKSMGWNSQNLRNTHLSTAKRCSSCLDNSCTFSSLIGNNSHIPLPHGKMKQQIFPTVFGWDSP